jgi:small subunit ribosomal protein S16
VGALLLEGVRGSKAIGSIQKNLIKANMVTIRLARAGSKQRPFYHIVVTDARKPRDGAFIERLGYINPVAAGQETPYKLDLDRSRQWIEKGAQPTQRVANLIRQAERAEQAAQ